MEVVEVMPADGIEVYLTSIFGIVGGVFGLVVIVLGLLYVLLMKKNIYGYGMKKHIDEKGNKKIEFWLLLFAQISHIIVMLVFNMISTSFIATALWVSTILTL